MLLELKQLTVPPGQRVLLQHLNWKTFELILEDLGEHRASRIAYDHETLEIMTPLPEHEQAKEIIGDLIKALLEELEIEFCSLGSTTFKNKRMSQGIEPDQCFYIKNEPTIRGRDRLDLSVDPPPDLVLEIDITSRTHSEIYRQLQVPELWRFEQGQLQINVLKSDLAQGNQYVISADSLNFPGLPLIVKIPEFVAKSKTDGRSAALKAFRAWIKETVQKDAPNNN
jgi:Uma2 family endonuclease